MKWPRSFSSLLPCTTTDKLNLTAPKGEGEGGGGEEGGASGGGRVATFEERVLSLG